MHTGFLKSLGLAIAIALGSGPSALAQERVVSLGGDVTEIIYALGGGDRIVASDSTSLYPPAAQETAKVGYLRNLSAEGVLSVEPDLVILSGAAGPPEALELIRASGVEIIEMETAYTLETILEKTRRVASALGDEAAGKALVAKIEADWAEAQSEISKLGPERDMLFFATLRDGVPRAAGTETAAHGVVELLGGTNLFASQTGYKQLSLEAAVAADPDIILVLNHYGIAEGTIDDAINHPALSLTSAAQNRDVFLVDPVKAIQFGPRTPAEIGALARAINAKRDAQDDS